MLKELGQYKLRLYSILANDEIIKKLLMGDDYENTVEDIDTELDKHIIQHLYVEGTITETQSYVMFDTLVTKTHSSTKSMKIIIQTLCHKDIVKYKEKPQGYFGYRYDVLAQRIEELLCPEDKEKQAEIIEKFGIGNLSLLDVSVDVSNKYIGRTLTFVTPDFR